MPVPNVKVGQRVRRKDSKEEGTVIEIVPELKVKWDSGRTSYFRRGQEANVQESRKPQGRPGTIGDAEQKIAQPG